MSKKLNGGHQLILECPLLQVSAIFVMGCFTKQESRPFLHPKISLLAMHAAVA